MANASAEKQRAYRRRRDADPARREKYLMNERERWRRDIETGKRKRIGDLGEKAQIMRRKQWREAKERQKTRFFKIIASPECSPKASLMALLNNQDVPSAWTNHQRPYAGQFRLKNEVVNNKVHQLGDPVK